MNSSVRRSGNSDVMGYKNDSYPVISAEPLEQPQYRRHRSTVQTASGFIGVKHRRIIGQSASHGYPLAFPSGQLCWSTVRKVSESDVSEQGLRSPGSLGTRAVRTHHGYLDIAQRGEARQQVVELEHQPHLLPAETVGILEVLQFVGAYANGP